MSETVYHRYRLKRRTTAGWAANNEVLLAGEPGIEVLVDGTERIKYGDGVKTWAQLSYAAGGGGVGPAGPTGPAGPAGAAGAAATVGVGTVTTGAAGSAAAVTNAGTSSAAVFDFTIPRGDTGAAGPQGPAGAAGAAATIAVGTVTTGAAGSAAAINNAGTNGAAVFDFTIPRGDTGATGAQGPAGPVAGTNGQVIYNNAGAAGGLSTLTADANGNLTFTARWIQSTNGAASAPPMALTGTWFTGGTSTTTKPQFLIEPAGTTSTNWSTAGTGLGVNAPSGFTGDLAWFGVGGDLRFRIRQDGGIVSQFNGLIANEDAGANRRWWTIGGLANDSFTFARVLAVRYMVDSPGVQVRSDAFIGWSDTTANSWINDAFNGARLYRDADHIIAQRNGTNAQTYRIYNTFTNSTNYERLAHTWVSNVCYTRPENAGTGSARLYVPVTGGTTVANLPAAATAGTGARSFVTDANATTFLSTVAGGGSNRVPVVSDGTNWLIA
jgi:hypothetical protein